MGKIVMANDVMADLIEEAVNKGETVRLRVQGNSMFPFLRNGKDVVEIRKVRGEEVRRGDVILFRYSSSFILHRVVRRNGAVVKTQGDGVWNFFETIAANQIIGVARLVVRENGKMVKLDSMGWIVLANFWISLRFLRRYLLFVLYKVRR